MGADSVGALREVGELLASLKEPEAPRGLRDALGKVALLKSALWDMAPREIRSAPCQEVRIEGPDVDLARLPIQTCWPGDAGPLITWGLVVTRHPDKPRQNLGIYRQQVIGRNKLIMRWLAHRGGALDFRDHALRIKSPALSDRRGPRRGPGHDSGRGHARPGQPLGVSVRRPVARRAHRDSGNPCAGNDLRVPATAEIVLEGHLHPQSKSPAGPADAPLDQPRTMSWHSKGRSATTPATTTNGTGSRCSPSTALQREVTRSITRPTPASRRTSPPSSVLH